MDTIIPQAGNNVASQYMKPTELPVFERVSQVNDSGEAKSDAQNANIANKQSSEVLSTEAQQIAKGISSEADTQQREESVVQVEQALVDISEFLQNRNTQLAFSIDEATDKSVVTVKDAASGDVIRQIPSEEVLKFAERINELQSEFGSSAGILLRGQA
jgi:flagellar protein FlaG